jgi:circadian clock protein KaiB
VKTSKPRGGRRSAARIELVLYISPSSPSSVRAVANMRRILRNYKSGQIELTVCDLTKDPSAGELDRIAFTPTLCKRQPEPPMWILGDLSHPEPLLELLAFHGVETVHGHRQADNGHSGVRHSHARRHS